MVSIQYRWYGHQLVPNLLLFFEGTDEIVHPSGFCWWRDKDPKFGRDTAVSKGELVGHVDDVAAYAVSHDCPYVLGLRTTSPSVLERVSLICQKAKSHARRHLETMRECVDPALHSRVIVESVAVKVAEFKGISLQGGASK